MKKKTCTSLFAIISLFGIGAAGLSSFSVLSTNKIQEAKAVDFNYVDKDIVSFKGVVYSSWLTFVLDGETDYSTDQATIYHLDVKELNMWTNIYCNNDESLKLYTTTQSSWTGVTFNISTYVNGISGQVNAELVEDNVLKQSVTRVTVPAGTEFPSRAVAEGTGNIVYRTTKTVNFVRNGSSWAIEPNIDDNEVANYFAVEGTWNPGNLSTYSGFYTYAIRFSGVTTGTDFTFGGTADTTDMSMSIGSNITLNGQSFNAVGCKVHYGFGNFYVGLSIDPAALTHEYNIVEIKQDTVFQFHKLNAVRLIVEKTTGKIYSLNAATGINWNNLDYGSFAVTEGVDTLTNSVPNNGYCVLIKFNKNLTGNEDPNNNNYINFKKSTVTNLLDHVYVNGTLLSSNSKAIIGSYAGMLYLYIPNDFGYRPYVEITEGGYVGKDITGYVYLEHTQLIADGGIGYHSIWNLVDTPKAISDVSYTGISWNNISYVEDYKDAQGNQKKGLLINFSDNLSTNNVIFNGAMKNYNLAPTSTIGSKIKLNGTPFNEIANAEIKYFSTNLLWMYVPEMGTKGNVIEVSPLTIDDAKTDTVYFKFDGSQWAPATKIIFDTNGGSTLDPYFGLKGSEKLSDIGNTFVSSKTGYRLDGWTLNGSPIGADDVCTGLEQTLVANWVEQRTVTFVTPSGNIDVSVDVGGYVARPSVDPTKENGHFDDWYIDDSYSVKFDFANTIINENTPIYAKFIDCVDGEITYSEPTADHKMTATLYCGIVTDEVIATETVDGVYHMDSAATCLDGESGHYKYTFSNSKFVEKTENVVKDNATGHKWSVTVTWDGKFAIANATCENGCGETLFERKEATYVKDTDATCNSYEKGHFEVTFDNTELGSAKTEENSYINTESIKPSHDFGTAEYVWEETSSGWSCVATQECVNNNCEETNIETATVTFEVTKDPTCTEKGEGIYTAKFETIPQTTKVVDIDPSGHDLENCDGEPATCNEDGYKEAYYCNNCKQYFEDEDADHLIGNLEDYEAWIVGEGKISKKTVEHSPAEPVRENIVEPTCTEAGSYDEVVYCSVCHEELLRTKISIPATGHIWNEGEVTKAPTCTEDGVKTFTCECGETKTEVIPATGHKLGELIPEVAATTEKEGMKAHYVCSECGQYFDANKQECTAESLVIAKLPEPTPEPKKGCGGSVIAASAVATGLAIAGAALIAAKKKED